jgi:sterol desaturase/sphingolipid hydroxylase (fatty acid hydroxylase superfamily)
MLGEREECMRRLREAVRTGAFPVLLFGGVGAAVALHQAAQPEWVAVGVPVFVVSLVLLVLQRWLPFDEGWRGTPKDFGLDLLHMLTTTVAGEAWRAVFLGLVVQASVWMAASFGGLLWPWSWPFVVQVGLALLIGDLGAYALHRACHETSIGWRIHAMHHSTERMYVFAASRSHPVNFVLAWAAAVVPLVLVGCPPEILLATGAFTAVNGMIQHANVDLHYGLSNLVFSTGDLHRWHHSASHAESNCNYGSNLIVWDRLLGTFFLPSDRRRPERVGIDGLAMPANWWAHLASPVLLDRWADLPEVDDFTLEHAVSTPAPCVRGESPMEQAPRAPGL